MKFQNSTLHSKTFTEMNLPPALMTALEKMAITKPSLIQSQAIPAALAGTDTVAIAQTGSGKTLAYALPILTLLAKNETTRALVLTPSREMAQQIHKVFLDLCVEMPISACLAIGGMTGSKQANQLKKNPRVIVATPGRMNDHLQGNKLLLQNVGVIVIDEADRMLDMGFAPQLRTIQSTLRGPRQTLMFSASFNSGVEGIAESFMNRESVMIRSALAEEPVTSLRQTVLLLDRSMKKDRLLDELNAAKGSVIVFTGSQESCEEIGAYVKSYGFDTDLIHGGMTQGHRNRVVREFRNGEIRVVVATDLLARGLDVPHVECVMNYDLPFKAEDFLHRIGRTARAGRGGTAVTFVTPSDTRTYQKIKGYLTDAKEIMVDPNFKFLDRSRVFNGKERTGTDERPSRAGGKDSRAPRGAGGNKNNKSFDSREKKPSTGKPAFAAKKSSAGGKSAFAGKPSAGRPARSKKAGGKFSDRKSR